MPTVAAPLPGRPGWLPSFNMDSRTFGEATLESERLFSEALHLLGLGSWQENPAFQIHHVHSYEPSAFSIRLDAPGVAPLFFDFDEIFQVEVPGGAPIEIDRSDFLGAHGVIFSVIQVLTARISVRYSRLCRITTCTISDPEQNRKPGSSTRLESLWSNWPSGIRGTTITYEPFATS